MKTYTKKTAIGTYHVLIEYLDLSNIAHHTVDVRLFMRSVWMVGNESDGASVLPDCGFFSVVYLINFPFTFTLFS